MVSYLFLLIYLRYTIKLLFSIEIVSCMYILSYDIVDRISYTASSCWKIFVETRPGRGSVSPFDNCAATLDILIYDLIDVINSEYTEVHNIGTKTLNSVVQKIPDKIIPQSVTILQKSIDEPQEEST
jgi:hypothetical protein